MGLPAVAAKPRTSREDGTPVVAGGTAPRLRRRLRRASLHSLREPRLVGGSGIEPLTPSMSRLGNDLKNQLFRCLAPGLLPVWRRQQYRCAFGLIGDEVMDVRRSRSRVFPAPSARQCMVVHAATNAPRRIAVGSESRARVSGMTGQRSPLPGPAACADSRPDESERCVRRGHAPETARLLLSATCQPCVTDAAALP